VTQLSGTGLLADDLYLLAHDDATGRPFLQPRAAGLGLAGALLGELVLAGRIGLRAGGIEILSPTPPEDGLARHVLGLALREREWHPVRDWLIFLAVTAEQDVARRLEHAGYLMQASSRLPRRAGRWIPADPDCAFAPLVRVRTALDPARRTSMTDAALAGLAAACGLGVRILPYGPPGARRLLDQSVLRLDPDLRELVAQTQAAVDGVVLSHRA
jgi:hypothetical protein